MAVVGGDERDVELLLHLEERVADRLVRGQAVVLNFEEVVALAEEILIEAGGAFRVVVLPCHQVLVDFAGETAGEADESFAVFGEELFADAWLAVEAVESRLAGEADEVAVTRFVFGEDEEMVVGVAFGSATVVFVFADVQLAAEDGLEALLVHGVEEVDRAVDVAVVGHGGGGLTDFAEVSGEFVYVTGAIEEGVIGVKMKVGKLCRHVSILWRLGRGFC